MTTSNAQATLTRRRKRLEHDVTENVHKLLGVYTLHPISPFALELIGSLTRIALALALDDVQKDTEKSTIV